MWSASVHVKSQKTVLGAGDEAKASWSGFGLGGVEQPALPLPVRVTVGSMVIGRARAVLRAQAAGTSRRTAQPVPWRTSVWVMGSTSPGRVDLLASQATAGARAATGVPLAVKV